MPPAESNALMMGFIVVLAQNDPRCSEPSPSPSVELVQIKKLKLALEKKIGEKDVNSEDNCKVLEFIAIIPQRS
jgi:hypothetical protein